LGDLEPAILAIVSKLATAPGDATAANQNTIIAAVAVVDAIVDAIKAKTDNLPTDPADESLLEAAIADLITRAKGLDDIHDDVGTVDGKADTIITDVAAVNTDLGDFSAQVNLQSLLASLGVPDVAGKPLYTCLVTDRLDHATYGLPSIRNHQAEVSDVIIYPVAEHAATTEIADDGTSPAFYADTESGTATLESAPNVHWSEDIDFEQSGTINVISIFAELRWEHKTSGGTAYSKVQMSRDGGSNWVDMTDSIAETNVAYQDKTRIGVGRFVTTIVAGANQLEFRLVSWEAGGATSSAKIRSDSYMRLTYRKS